MRKVLVLSALVLALVFMAESSYAAKVCVQDNFGGYWELKGGKIDKKSYTLKFVSPGATYFCTGYADATLTNAGGLVLSLLNSHNTVGTCQNVFWSASTNFLFGGSGEYDIWGDGSIEGNFSINPISCTQVPPVKPYGNEKNHPNITRK